MDEGHSLYGGTSYYQRWSGVKRGLLWKKWCIEIWCSLLSSLSGHLVENCHWHSVSQTPPGHSFQGDGHYYIATATRCTPSQVQYKAPVLQRVDGSNWAFSFSYERLEFMSLAKSRVQEHCWLQVMSIDLFMWSYFSLSFYSSYFPSWHLISAHLLFCM